MNDTPIEPKRVLIPTDKLPAFIQKAYELSQPQGMGYLHYTDKPLSDEEIALIMNPKFGNGSIRLDYVKGRAVKLNIAKVGEQYSVLDYDGSWYDHSERQFLELLKSVE